MNQKGFANIVLIILVVILAGTAGYFALVKKTPEITQQTNTPTPTPTQIKAQTPNSTITTNGEFSDWQSHTNTEIGFSFKYPATWKVEDNLKVNTCCLNIFNSTSPYQGDALKQSVMKAQFQYHSDTSISSKQQYIDSLIKSGNESEIPYTINKSSIVSVQNKNGLEILRFSGGIGNVGYVIPRKNNFSEFIYVIVWNPDSTFEKVLATLKLNQAASVQSLPTSCVDQPEAKAVITSLSSYSGSVGTKLEIRGCNFAGFEGDKNAWIENSQGVKGILYGEQDSTAKVIKVTLKSPLCSQDNSYSGLPCSSYLTLAPGTYKIWTMPWGQNTKSNLATFTIQ